MKNESHFFGYFSLIKRSVLPLCIFLEFLSVGCTETEERSSSPSISVDKYKEDSTLMINVANKFIRETDAKKLHEVVVATQISRAMECRDYNEECNIFRSIMVKLIDFTKDSSYLPEERLILEKELLNLKMAVREGTHKLEKQISASKRKR